MRSPLPRARPLAAGLAVAVGLGLAGAGTAAAADPILPLSEVTPGMVGEARTVVRGTDIVTFPVSVIDVQRSADGPGGSLILARAEGPLMTQTGGVAEGMSGSPVYVTGADGVPRVIGAIAYGSGDQDNVIVGVTPIEQMIDSSSGQRANERPAPPTASPVRRVTRVRTRAAARALEARRPDQIGLYPLTRWTLAGVSRPLVASVSKQLAQSGIQLTSIGPRTPRPPVALVPGSSLTALVAGGDVVLGAIGTTTYVDGTTVLGFGHPFLGAGRTRFLMGDGYVYQTIPAPIAGASYKLGEPGTLQGMIVGDRADGVTGRIGPVEAISAVATATDASRGTQSTVRATLAPDERTAPIAAGLVQDEPAVRVTDGLGAGTLTLSIAISSPDLKRPFVYRNVFAAAGDVVSLASGQLPWLVAIMMQNGTRPVPISDISVREKISSSVRAARIVGASIRPRRVRAGGRATLVLRVQPWRASPRVIKVPVRLPRGLFPGASGIRVVPKSAGGFDSSQPDLSQDLGATAGLASRAAAVRRVERLARKARGSRLTRVISGLRRATDDRHDAVRLLGPGDDADDPASGVTVAVPYVIFGGRAAVRVTVR